MIKISLRLWILIGICLVCSGIVTAHQSNTGIADEPAQLTSDSKINHTTTILDSGEDFWAISEPELPVWKRNVLTSTGVIAVAAGFAEQVNSAIAAVAIGGALGSVTRYVVSKGVGGWMEKDYPYGTVAVNVIGSFAFGVLSGWVGLRDETPDGVWFTLLTTGFLGGFTTFSTFTYDTLSLAHEEGLHSALIYTMLSVGVSVMAIFIGEFTGNSWRNALTQPYGTL